MQRYVHQLVANPVWQLFGTEQVMYGGEVASHKTKIISLAERCCKAPKSGSCRFFGFSILSNAFYITVIWSNAIIKILILASAHSSFKSIKSISDNIKAKYSLSNMHRVGLKNIPMYWLNVKLWLSL